jgi:scyllo-inositol 2-dehydrogenase (NADP+)
MFRSAVIGIGGIGKWHAAMQRDTKAMNVVALCDSNPALKEWAAQDFPDAHFYTSTDELFAKESLDLVSVITPHNLHAPLAIEALKRGINVVVEKPMATSYADAKAMVEAARQHKRFVSVFHNRRLDPWFLAAKKAIDAGLLGRLIELKISVNYGPGPNTWRGFTGPSGGLQFDWGAHLVDYALHLAGGEVRNVAGFAWRKPDKPADQVEDHAETTLYFESGTIAHITTRGKAFNEPERYHFVGDKGTLTDTWNWNDNGAVKVFTRVEGFAAELSIPYVKTKVQDYYDNVAAHMTDGKPLLVTGESAARVINVLCAGRRSAELNNVPQPLEPAI